MRKAWSGHERMKCKNMALSRGGPGVMKRKKPEDASLKGITTILKISNKLELVHVTAGDWCKETADEQSLY